MLAAFITTILFSLSVVCGYRSAKLIGGLEANFWRLALAGLFLGCWSYTFGIGLDCAAFPIFFLSGILGIGVGDVALFQALPRLGSRLSMLLIHCMTAPIGALLEWLWLGTKLTMWQVLGGITILIGVGMALTPGHHLKLTRRQLVIGILASALAAFGGAEGAVLSRKAYMVTNANGQHIDGANAAFQRIMGGLLIGGLCLLAVKRTELRVQSRAHAKNILEVSKKKWRTAWPWVLLNSVAGQTIGVSFMQRALETAPTGVVLAIIATTPVMVLPFTILLEGERLSLRPMIGGIIAVSGVIFLALSH